MYVKSDKVYNAKQFSDYGIASATALGNGVPVVLSSGKVIGATAAGTSQAFLGITAESHAGADGALELKSRRELIAIHDSPHAVFGARGILLTNTADSAAGVVTIANTITADRYNLKKVVCVKAMSGSDYVVGKEYTITDGTTSTLVLTASTAVKAGDQFKLYPDVGDTQIGFAVDSNNALTGELALSSTGAILKVISVDKEADEVCVICTAHTLA